MINTYLSHNNIISALGFDTDTVIKNVHNGISGIRQVHDNTLFPEPFYAAPIDTPALEDAFVPLGASENYTRLEKMLLLSLDRTLRASQEKITPRTGLLIATTKGNIDALDPKRSFPPEKAYLGDLGEVVKNYFGFTTEPIILSNACVSGVLAIAVAKRFLAQGLFDKVFIAAGDVLSPFILSGFQSFQALSDQPCRPYDKQRSGINLGEVAASILVTPDQNNLSPDAVQILGDGSCNDANHISGPSRTGEGLYRSVLSALLEAGVTASEIDYISAHGTATQYNDEMEAIAFDRLRLGGTPLNSYKGYFGHTLGASGLLETILGMRSLYHNTLYRSLGLQELGVSPTVSVVTATTSKKMTVFLKTASGFGGCNTAVILKKANL